VNDHARLCRRASIGQAFSIRFAISPAFRLARNSLTAAGVDSDAATERRRGPGALRPRLRRYFAVKK
jgi:hypothetical protein